MKTVEDYKKEFDAIKLEVSSLIEKLGLKFTTEEFLQIDSITFNNIPNLSNANEKELKRDYLILANETYEIRNEETGKMDKFKTRTLLLSLRLSKIKKLSTEELVKILIDYVKLIYFYEKYKLLFKDLSNQMYLNNPVVATYFKLTDYLNDEEQEQIYKEIPTSYWKFFNFKNEIYKEDYFAYLNRSKYLYNKLKKKED